MSLPNEASDPRTVCSCLSVYSEESYRPAAAVGLSWRVLVGQ